MTDLDTRKPEFSFAMRGYDRHQVDGYVERLQLLLQEAEQRAREAEAATPATAVNEPPVRTLRAVSDREAEPAEPHSVSDRKAEPAEPHPGQPAREDAARLLETARRQAQAMIDEANRTAESTLRRSAREQRSLIEQLRLERDRLLEEIAKLEQRVDAASAPTLAGRRHPRQRPRRPG